MTFATTGMTTGPSGTTVSGHLSVGASRTHLELPVEIEPAGADAVTLRARVALPREDVGLAWNKAGMIKGPARLELDVRLMAPS